MIIPGNYVPGKILLGWSSGFYLAVQKRALANDRQIRFQRFRPDSRSYPRRLTTRWNLYRCCCHRCFYFASTSAVSSSVCVPLDRPRACSPHHHLPFLSFFIIFFFFFSSSSEFPRSYKTQAEKHVRVYRKIERPLTDSHHRCSPFLYFSLILQRRLFIGFLKSSTIGTLPLSPSMF